jgi:hypothetical protein
MAVSDKEKGICDKLFVLKQVSSQILFLSYLTKGSKSLKGHEAHFHSRS